MFHDFFAGTMALGTVVNRRGERHISGMGSDGIPSVDTQDDPPVIRKKNIC